MKFLISVLISFFAFPTFAQEQTCPVTPGFLQTIEGLRAFGETEFLARNHSIGLYRGGQIALKPWVSISEFATVGIDQDGNVVQVLRFIDKHGTQRQVAAFLSTGEKYKTLFISNDGQLFAFTRNGSKLHVFNWEKWKSNSAMKSIEKTQGRMTWSICGLNGVMLAATAIHSVVTGELPLEYLIGGAMGSIGLTMTHLALIGRKYEVANEETNGFVSTHIFLKSPIKSTQYQWSEKGEGVSDYEITLEDGQKARLTDGLKQLSDSELPNTPVGGVNAFDLTCDHALLPRGISEESYESAWRKRG